MFILNEEQRWYIINEWKKRSTSISKIARSINCHISTVYRVIDYYCCHRTVNYGHDVGRPSALNSKQMKKLDLAIQNNRSATASELLSITSINTTERTIQRYRRSLDYSPRKSTVKVKTNNISEEKRYQFALLHYRSPIEKYIFEDECYVGLRNTNQIVWCKRGEPTPRKEISSLRAYINLIGFTWWNGFVFRRFDTWLNGDTYCDTVNEALSGYLRQLNRFSYVSDGVKWHISLQFQQWCAHHNIKLCEWPGYSPDFNAIELVWNILKQKTKRKNPKSQRELEIAIDDALNDLSLNTVQSCITKTQEIYEQFVSSC